MDLSGVDTASVIQVEENQTVIVSSLLCNESVIFGLVNGETYFQTILSTNINVIKNKCMENGFSPNYVYAELNQEGCAYLIPAHSKQGIALCVEEVYRDLGFHLLFSKVNVLDWQTSKKHDYKENEY